MFGFVSRFFKDRREKRMVQAIGHVLSSTPTAESYRNAGMTEDMIKLALESDRWLAEARAEHAKRMSHDKEYARRIEEAREHVRAEEFSLMGGCPACRKPLKEHGGKWCACPTCNKPFGPDHNCKTGGR